MKRSFYTSYLYGRIISLAFALILTTLFLSSCGGGASISTGTQNESQVIDTDSVNQNMDILWVVDCSASMKQEIQRVQRNLLSFARFFISTNYNFRIGVISTSAWSQLHYDAEEALLLDPTNPALLIDGLNVANGGALNKFLPPLNLLHSGQAIRDASSAPFEALNAPFLDLSQITQDDVDAQNIKFCESRGYDFNYDGDFNDTVSNNTILETYIGHEIDFNNDGDPFDKVNGVDESIYGIDFNRDGDTNDIVNNVAETVSGWSIDLNGDLDTDDIINATLIAGVELDEDDPIADNCEDFDIWIAAHPNSFLSKFNKNIDVFGVNSGGTHCGKLNKGGNFDTGVNAYHGDEREFQSVRAFLDRSDYSATLAQSSEASESADRSYWNQFTGTDWVNSTSSAFIRPAAYLAVIMITDEKDGSRSQMDPQLDNGSFDNINNAGIASHYPRCNYVLPCAEANGSVIEYESDTDFLNYLTTKKGSTDLFGVYAITKTSNDAQFKVLRDAADLSGGFSVNIDDKFYAPFLEQISANIIEQSSVYPLARLPIESTVSVSFTFDADGPGGNPPVTVNIPEDQTEVNGFKYFAVGNYVKIYGQEFLPPQNADFNITYVPQTLN